MDNYESMHVVVFSMLFTAIVLAGFVISAPVDPASKAVAILVPTVISGIISAAMCFFYILLQK